MIILADQPTANEKRKALALVEADTWNAWEMYEVLYSPALGEIVGTVGEDHVRFICAGLGATLMSEALSRLMQWSAPQGEITSLRDLVDRMDALMRDAESRLSGLKG